jgi:HEAT repeat protein
MRITTFAIVCIALQVSVRAAEPDGPTHRGQPVRPWERQLADKEAPVRLQAVRALGALGFQDPAAIVPLGRALGDAEELVRAEAARVLGWLGPRAAEALRPLVRALREEGKVGAEAQGALARLGAPAVPALRALLRDPDVPVRLAALGVLRRMGPAADAAVPDLIDCLDDEETALDALVALAWMGERAVPALVAGLEARRPGPVRRKAMWGLCRLAPASRRAVPEMLAGLTDADVQVWAATALGECPLERSAAAPLLAACQAADSQVRSAALVALAGATTVEERLPVLIRALLDEDYDVQICAAREISRVGRQALPALPGLLEALQAPRLRGNDAFAEVLGSFGAAAVPPLCHLAGTHAESKVRARALGALAAVGPEARPALPLLLGALKDDDRAIRAQAARVLAALGPESRAALPALIEQFRESSSALLDAAYEALEAIGPEAVPPLIAALRHRELEVRMRAARALGKLGVTAQEAICPLMDIMRDEEWGLRFNAAVALGDMGPHGAGAVPELSRALQDKHPLVRERAACALGQMKGEARAALPALVQALRDDRQAVAVLAACALGEIGDPKAVPTLVEYLQERSCPFRWACALALGSMGSGAREAIPALLEAAQEEDAYLRRFAAGALGRVGRTAGAVVPALVQRLADKDLDVRVAALESLAQLGASVRPALPDLQEAVFAEDAREVSAALLALGTVEAEPRAVLPWLTEALRREETRVRLGAVQALERLGPPARPAVPELLLLVGSDREVRTAAIRTLGRIGAAEAVPVLERQLQDGDPGTRLAAAVALVRTDVSEAHEAGAASLLLHLRDRDARTRSLAIQHLAEVGRQVPGTAEALGRCLTDGAPGVRRDAARVLRTLRPQDMADR